jgi:hypothetical protein
MGDDARLDFDRQRLAFDKEKVVFEQNCAQLRTLVPELHRKPLTAATLTGGLLAALSVFKADPTKDQAIYVG